MLMKKPSSKIKITGDLGANMDCEITRIEENEQSKDETLHEFNSSFLKIDVTGLVTH